jgi:hypothetical protein
MKIAILICTRNRLSALDALLESISNSNLTPDQVVISSSGANISTVLSKYREKMKITHVETELFGQIRQKMLENWDGFDYIDGEYIKDNLKLHYTDTNYPTLDHVKPRSVCFKEGLTPEETTKPENLKWTKRVNNSSKSNKYNKI